MWISCKEWQRIEKLQRDLYLLALRISKLEDSSDLYLHSVQAPSRQAGNDPTRKRPE
jgi:hypothetical protein